MASLMEKFKKILVKENFNIASSEYLTGKWIHGGANYIGISNKKAVLKSVVDSVTTAMTFINVGMKNYYVEVEFSTMSFSQFFYIKGDNDSYFITLSYSNNKVEIREYVNWVVTSTFYDKTISNGDIVGALCNNNKITIYINDVQAFEYTMKDTRFVNSTHTGMMIRGNNTPAFDNFIVYEVNLDGGSESNPQAPDTAEEKDDPVIPDIPNQEDSQDEFYTGYFNEAEITNFTGNNIYYMSLKGNDSNDGKTRNNPLLTLDGFKNKIEKSSNISEATLYVEDGDYKLTKTFDLSGNKFGKTVTVNIIGIGNKAQFTTADKLDNSKFSLIDMNNTKVYKYDLSRLNINFTLGMANYNTDYRTNANVFEAPFLICNEERMYLASYPKGDKWTLSNENDAVSYSNGFYITAKSGNDRNRLNSIKNWSNVFIDGFIGTPYANHQVLVTGYDSSSGRITASNRTPDWNWQKYTGGIRYRLVNIKDEVKDPGEYYIDYSQKILYFIPPQGVDIKSCKIQLAHKKYGNYIGAFYNSYENVDSNKYYEGSKVNFKKINFSGFRDDIFAEVISNMKFEKCIFKNTCYSAIKTLSPKNLNIVNCRFANISGRTVVINNKDYLKPALKSRLDLVSCNCTVSGCVFKNTGYLYPWCGYSVPIYIASVGSIVKNNKFTHNPGISIRFAQNDNVIDGNTIKDGCFLLADSGSIYGGRDWAARGNVISNNYLYDNTPYFNDSNWRIGIYLDDAISGNKVLNNHVVGYKVGILYGGGRDTVISNNTLEKCNIPIVADARGLEWMNLDQLYYSLAVVYPNYTNSVWKSKYSGIETLPQSDPNYNRNKNLSDPNCPAYPKNNTITNNKYLNCYSGHSINNNVINYGNVNNNN